MYSVLYQVYVKWFYCENIKHKYIYIYQKENWIQTKTFYFAFSIRYSKSYFTFYSLGFHPERHRYLLKQMFINFYILQKISIVYLWQMILTIIDFLFSFSYLFYPFRRKHIFSYFFSLKEDKTGVIPWKRWGFSNYLQNKSKYH